ncbi:unnamed protein product, partial [Ectocarpus sp. 12 AP-2014]
MPSLQPPDPVGPYRLDYCSSPTSENTLQRCCLTRWRRRLSSASRQQHRPAYGASRGLDASTSALDTTGDTPSSAFTRKQH